MIICGSLPTLQRFFRQVAPKLMGGETKDTAKGGSQKKAAGSTMLRTFGQGNHRGHSYNKFGESDTEVAMTVLDTAGTDDEYPRSDADVEHRIVQVGTVSVDQDEQELISHTSNPGTLGSHEGDVVQVTETIEKK